MEEGHKWTRDDRWRRALRFLGGGVLEEHKVAV